MERLELSSVCPTVLRALDKDLAAAQHLRFLYRAVFALLHCAVCLHIRVWQLFAVHSTTHSAVLTAAYSIPFFHEYWSTGKLRDLLLKC